MDLLSAAASALSIAASAFQISKLIHSGVESINNADSKLLQLQREVDALQSGLESIASTFQSTEVIQPCTSKSGAQSQSSKLLTSVKPLLEDCEVTLEKLRFMLEWVDKPGAGILRKPAIALKISLKSDDINAIRHQIRSYSSAMQMTLNMVGICLSVDGNNHIQTLGNTLGQKLENLGAQITEIQKQMSQTNQNISGSTIVGDEMDTKKHTKHIEKYIQTAKIIFSNGSVYCDSVAGTVVGDSTEIDDPVGTFGSVLGMNDAQKLRVNESLPRPIPEGSTTSTDIDEDEDVVDKDMFLARLTVAQKRLEAAIMALLAEAAELNLVGAVRILVAKGANVEGDGVDGACPLWLASKYGNVEVVRLLLDAGAEINKISGPTTVTRITALMAAAFEGHFGVIQLFLERGANIRYIEDSGERWSLLSQASGAGNTEIVHLLLDAGAEINWRNGYTALHCTVEEGHVRVIRLLLERGADPKLRYAGKTALDIAKTNEKQEAVDVLKEARTGRAGFFRW